MVSKTQKPILFVDLDESLIKTDIFREQFIRSLAIAPWKTIRILFRERFQPERVKAAIAEIITTDPSTLPYNQEVLNLIHHAKKEKRKVVLATATYEKVAHSIAKHLGIFDAVLSTTRTYNCKGRKKLKVMKEYADGRPFDYVGDSRVDYPILDECQTAYIVGSLRYSSPHKVIARSSIFPAFLKAIRPHQWAKNGLIFLPLFTSHQITLTSLKTSFFGFICFSMAASAIYIINDMVDVEDDRHQLNKKDRPFAKGNLTIDEGLWLSSILLICSISLSSFWLPAGLWVLASYIILTFLYSFSLKALPIMDVFCLSTLYSLRVLYGQVINLIESSSWLLAFCVFFFLSLAFMKRSAEIEKTQRKQQPLTTRRGYKLDDYVLLQTSGVCSGLLSILVLMLYINSVQVMKLYMYPEYLWGSAYVLLYWKLRFWLITARGKMDHDPVLFAISDPTSYAIAVAVFLFGLFAKGIF